MESRSATRLGQNVQLLTYVSIFYLPLGFCAVSFEITLLFIVRLLKATGSLGSPQHYPE